MQMTEFFSFLANALIPLEDFHLTKFFLFVFELPLKRQLTTDYEIFRVSLYFCHFPDF